MFLDEFFYCWHKNEQSTTSKGLLGMISCLMTKDEAKIALENCRSWFQQALRYSRQNSYGLPCQSFFFLAC